MYCLAVILHSLYTFRSSAAKFVLRLNFNIYLIFWGWPEFMNSILKSTGHLRIERSTLLRMNRYGADQA